MYIGIDVGGTSVRIASFDELRDPRLLAWEKFDVNNDYKLDLRNILHNIDKIATDELKGIGIGIPGTLDDDNKEIVDCPNLLDWNGKKIVRDVERAIGCLVKAENDTTLAALGEADFGLGKNQDFIFIIWGTGIGGTEIKQFDNRRLVFRFEPGHQIVGGGRQLEMVAGGSGIVTSFGKNPADLDEESWNTILPAFAQGITNILVIRPTKLVIFGGGIALNKPDKVDRVRALVKDYLTIYPVPKFRLSGLGEKVALFGALTLFSGE